MQDQPRIHSLSAAAACETSHKGGGLLSFNRPRHASRRLVAGALLCAAALIAAPALVFAGQAAPAAHAPATTAPAPAAQDSHAVAPAPVPADAAAQTAPAAHDATTPAAPEAGHQTPAPGAPVEAGHASAPAAADAHGAAQPAAGHAPAGGEHAAAGEEHGESPWGLIARLVNFIVLMGALWYFLRAPLSGYLASRSQQIRTELVTAKETTVVATRQLAEIDEKVKALPAELEALKKRGAEEIVAEEARIKQTAEGERQRLLEQTRREIELQVRMAKRELSDYAATLAVDLAADRIQKTATPDDQQRLIDRYVTQVRSAHD